MIRRSRKIKYFEIYGNIFDNPEFVKEDSRAKMKCPYRNFEECIVQECPSCNYEEIKQEIIEDISPARMSLNQALKEGLAWKKIMKRYKFISCKLVENGVQPIPAKKEIVNNTTKTSVMVKTSIF